MNGPERAYNILRGYWDRLVSVDEDLERNRSEIELEAALREASHRKSAAPSAQKQPRHSDEPELYELAPDKVGIARRLLGVSETATFELIRKTFIRVSERSDPENFPSGSDARTKAAEIHKRAYWAYQVLTEHFDATEKRFKSLELE